MDNIADKTSANSKLRVRLSSKSEQNALSPKPKVTFFALDMPAPLATLGIEGDVDGASHVLLLFRDWKQAKRVQLELSIKGIDAPVVERDFDIPKQPTMTREEMLERLDVQR